jgi:menaquinone-9 beta-reductase
MSSNKAKLDWDVVVVGGGPAGSAVAAWLAREGFAVALLDRARFPRDKACGEFLTPPTRTLLTDLGAWEALCAAGVRSVETMVLVAPDGNETRYTPPDASPVGYTLRRVALDRILLDAARQAGVAVYEGVAVRGVMRDEVGRGCGVVAQAEDGEKQEFRGRMVIGADGTHSLIARQLGLVRPLPRLQRVAVVSHWRGVSGPMESIEMRARGPVVCGLDFPGNTDSIPSANVTFVVPTERAAQIAGRKQDFLTQTLETQFPDVAERLSGAECEPIIRTVGCFGHVCRPPVAEGALLVGDAATFIDPFTGEGVYFALRGALLAAEVAASALRANDLSRARLLAYARIRRELTRRYLLCDVVQAVVRRPALLSRVVQRLDHVPGLADRLLSVIGDLRPPTDALHPAFLWRLLAPTYNAR